MRAHDLLRLGQRDLMNSKTTNPGTHVPAERADEPAGDRGDASKIEMPPSGEQGISNRPDDELRAADDDDEDAAETSEDEDADDFEEGDDDEDAEDDEDGEDGEDDDRDAG